MPYMTPTEFALIENVSRQAINDRMNRGTLPYVIRDHKVKRKLIVVTLEQELALARVQGKE